MTERGTGGGGEHRYGYVEVASVRVSNLVRRNQKAVYSGGGSLSAPSGYKTYGILSHNFLKHYAWTIDFDRKVFLFH